MIEDDDEAEQVEIDNEDLIRDSVFQPGHAEAMAVNAKNGLRCIVVAVDIERRSAWLIAALPTGHLAQVAMLELAQCGTPTLPAIDGKYRLIMTQVPDPRGITQLPGDMRLN